MTTTPANMLAHILDWLRAGYPAGIPRQDYVALAGVLHRALTPAEVEQFAAELAAGSQDPSEQDIADLIQSRVHERASAEDIARVSARLAEGGWPLARSPERRAEPGAPQVAESAFAAPAAPAHDSPGGHRPGLITRILDWLRAGYPAGVPTTDYIPLLALLRDRLTDAEVNEVATALREAGLAAPNAQEIGREITRITREAPSREDLQRVREHLSEMGWPPAFLDDTH